ncbi:penicillin-binding protein 1C [Pollutimonas sp. H1-120]|uniref:penicillin-binding protein 1C n=1 Tax=Pollutimonas sp. H1-120 TaxID=3148824 RepID=UPI003B52D0CD
MCTSRRLSACLFFGLAFAMLALPKAAIALPSYDQVKADAQSSDVLVLDRSGQLLERVRFDFQARRGDWIALEDMSIAFQRAVILSEDKRFYTHAGVDWRAMAAAAWDTLAHERRRGASTLSMQLLGLIDERFQRGPQGRGIMQKIDQAIEARRLEEQWSKPRILEAYLNLAAFRGELIGVDAVSRVLFRKHPSGLDARESALAAALLRGPNASAQIVARRACALLADMGAPDDCRDLAGYTRRILARKSGPWADRSSQAAHYARLALAQSHSEGPAPKTVQTTLDAGLQRFVVESIGRHLRALGMDNVRDAAVVVQDNRSGQILAYVGSSGDLSAAARVDHARALRQAGSTLKPFLYAQAIGQQRLTMASLLNDSPLDIPTGNGLYIPQNYDKRFSGWVSARTALASSLNIPALRVLLMTSPDAFARLLVRLGLPLDQSGDFYGYSLALGSADVTLLSLTNAYRALAGGGLYSPPRYLLDEQGAPPRRILSEAAAWIIGDVLSDRQARARTFGFDSPLSTPFWTAVKTGTSKDMRDNWCMGWSRDYTVGVWVGNSGGASMRDVSGVSGAGPVWHDIMSYLHRRRPSAQAPRPDDVAQVQVVFDNELEPARLEAFAGDTIVRRVHLAQDFVPRGQGVARIAAPADGVIFALDPDIPPDRQLSALRAKSVAAVTARDVSWRIDGRMLGRGGELDWAPWPGRHRIELLDAEGNVLDAVRVEVRGATPR